MRRNKNDKIVEPLKKRVKMDDYIFNLIKANNIQKW